MGGEDTNPMTIMPYKINKSAVNESHEKSNLNNNNNIQQIEYIDSDMEMSDNQPDNFETTLRKSVHEYNCNGQKGENKLDDDIMLDDIMKKEDNMKGNN
jgi:hypothetical protein